MPTQPFPPPLPDISQMPTQSEMHGLPIPSFGPPPPPPYDIAREETDRWGDDVPTRRLIFARWSELHALEAKRLRRRQAHLEEVLPQRAELLQVIQLRFERLQRERATLGPKDLRYLAKLLEHLPEEISMLHRARAELADLPATIAEHEEAAARWRERAAAEHE
jgi:hypothetical protein